MHSSLFISFLASATLAVAAPASESKRCKECPGTGDYYVCANNSFRGHCSVDPCAMKWCPDFKYKTCEKKSICEKKIVKTSCTTYTITTTYTDDDVYPTSTLSYTDDYPSYPTETSTYVNDYPTGASTYIDYYPTETSSYVDYRIETSSSYDDGYMISTATYDDSTTTPYPTETYSSAEATHTTDTIEKRTAFYVCANNGFRGDCSVDPCALHWCPDYKYKTYEPTTTWSRPEDDTETEPKKPQSYYQCASNKFDGMCSVDPCALRWCPDYKYKTYKPASTSSSTGTDTSATKHKAFYVCGNNGFRGDCSVDPCAMPWCPDYKYKTYTPAAVY